MSEEKYNSKHFDNLRLACNDLGISELKNRVYKFSEAEELRAMKLYINSLQDHCKKEIWKTIRY